MMRYGKAYGGADPEMIEGDIFRIIVKAPEFGATGERGGGPKSGPSRAHNRAHDKAHEPISEIESRIMENCSESPKSTPEPVSYTHLRAHET